MMDHEFLQENLILDDPAFYLFNVELQGLCIDAQVLEFDGLVFWSVEEL